MGGGVEIRGDGAGRGDAEMVGCAAARSCRGEAEKR